MTWNFACRCILTSFRTDWILVTVCWFFILWRYFNLVKLVKFRVSGHFLKNAWEEWPEILHASVFWPSKFIKFWSRSVDFSLFGANFTSRNGSNLGPPNILGRSPTLEGAEAFQNAGVLDCLVFHTCTVSNCVSAMIGSYSIQAFNASCHFSITILQGHCLCHWWLKSVDIFHHQRIMR